MRNLRALGYIKDTPQKAARFKVQRPTAVSPLAAYSAEQYEGDILDQNQCGSCTGHGSSQWAQVTYAVAGKPLPYRPSPKGIYAVTRMLDRAVGMRPGDVFPPLTDSGGQPSDVVIALATFGVRALVQPSPQGYATDVDPSNVCDEEKIGDLEAACAELMHATTRIPSTSDGATATAFRAGLQAGVQRCGAAGIGIFVDTAFENYSLATGPVQTCNLNDPNGSGHWLCSSSFRTCVAGSDDDVKFGIPVGTLIFRGPNSWGPGWGDGGHWEMTGPCLATTCSDCYVIDLNPGA
jgi:hypothetical protein